MILGIGLDISSVSNFERLLKDEVTTFIERHFTPGEIDYSKGCACGAPAEHLAVRYAAKEAAIKALEQGRGSKFEPLSNVNYLDMEVALDGEGRPHLKFNGQLKKLSREIGVEKVFLSLSHEGEFAAAVVILEGALPVA